MFRIISYVFYRYVVSIVYCCNVVNHMQCVFIMYCTFSCNIRNRVPYFVTMYCFVLCVFICRYICTINLLLLYQLKIQYHVHVIFRTHVLLLCTYTSVILLYLFVSYCRVPTFLWSYCIYCSTVYFLVCDITIEYRYCGVICINCTTGVLCTCRV
jgi:hypothetical protein